MKVTYITHSCFLIETAHNYLLFDYFEGELPQLSDDKTLICFASHSHPDHFSEKLFEVTASHSKTYYVLSSDIFKKRIPTELSDSVFFVKPHGNLRLEDIDITTLRSTDLGVAFMLEAGGKAIYHAGDLNNWQWEGETEDYNSKMESNYLRELERLKDKHIFAAFLPFDPRQSKAVRLKAVEQFLRYATVENIFPMHLWDEYATADELNAIKSQAQLCIARKKYDTFDLKER
jgi:L-ascorbate metabolism protein UlaG (beta-lactamase superfamily)